MGALCHRTGRTCPGTALPAIKRRTVVATWRDVLRGAGDMGADDARNQRPPARRRGAWEPRHGGWRRAAPLARSPSPPDLSGHGSDRVPGEGPVKVHDGARSGPPKLTSRSEGQIGRVRGAQHLSPRTRRRGSPLSSRRSGRALGRGAVEDHGRIGRRTRSVGRCPLVSIVLWIGEIPAIMMPV